MSGSGLLVSFVDGVAIPSVLLLTPFFPGAEEAAADGEMISHPLDIGYMGVHTVWTNDLGG
jgi:hypothetical protein